ncbi:MAG: glutamate--tRNA ligase [Methyloligellaceae bacterium]
MTAQVITRFAPSPTGFLHIGGARTALFNWLYARAKGGQMLLRIEDTDRARSTQAAIDAILDGLSWLELDWDGDTVFQSERIDRHREAAEMLLTQGRAYKCYCTPEELQAMRETARAEGRTASYDGTWRDRDPSEAPDGIDPVIRFKTPKEGETVVDDRVQGKVRFNNADLDDLILLRSDLTPTYMLSVVVDDHDMGVTHIVRGDDHLTNAARQSQIFKALGWQVPVFAHVPLIHGPDGAKLSKRHGALGIEAYRAMGYLPAALRNYLVRLGWSHGDEEIFSTEQLIDLFDLDVIGRSPARFDFAKLENLNGHYIRNADDDDLLDRIHTLLPEIEGNSDLLSAATEEIWAKVDIAMPTLKERAKTLVDLIEKAEFLLLRRPLKPDEKAAKRLDDEAQSRLGGLLQALEKVESWNRENLEESVRAFADDSGMKFGKIAQPLRAALTGRTVSPGIFDVLFVLGRDEALARIGDQAGET